MKIPSPSISCMKDKNLKRSTFRERISKLTCPKIRDIKQYRPIHQIPWMFPLLNGCSFVTIAGSSFPILFPTVQIATIN